MATWLPEYTGDPFPQTAFLGATIEIIDPNVTTNTGAQKSRSRPRNTKPREKHTTPIELTGRQLYRFKDWWLNTLKSGSLEFTWKNMMTDEDEAVYKFFEGKFPVFTMVVGASGEDPTTNVASLTRRRWVGSVELELL
jgi:hypothetical protein